MKVLGVGNDKYICEVSWDEIYEITSPSEYEEDIELRAGDEIDLNRIMRAAQWVRNLDQEQLDKIIKELQLTLVGVERVKASAEALNMFNRLSEKDVK